MKKLGMGLIAATILGLNISAMACTDFRTTAKDGSVVITRSMEFAYDLKSNLRNAVRGRVFNEVSSNGKPGASWKSKYGYLYLDGLDVDMAVDGMNEQGLSFEALYLPGEAKYQTVPAGHDNQAIPYFDIGHWILGNFKTVDEVRQALNNVYFYEQKIPTIGDMILPLHFAVYDNTGKGIVIEYVAGQLKVYDNQVGVMTNVPTFDWQVTNLRNYVNLKPTNPAPVVANGLTFAATGQGAGMVGLPGDISPPSRFVKTAILSAVAMQANDAGSAVNLAEHIINNVDIMRGLAREPGNGNYTLELTQWVVFKDLTHKNFYYRTYDNMTLRMVAMDKVDFSEKASLFKMPLESGSYVIDISNQFTKK